MVQGKLKTVIEFALIICVIIFVGCFPLLLQTGSIVAFMESILTSFYYLVHPQKIMIPLENGTTISFIEAVKEKYLNSVLILLGSFALACVFSLVFAFIVSSFSQKGKKVLNFILFIFQSMPDVLIVLLAQQFIIWIFKLTGISLTNIYEYGGNKIYLLPILCLSVIPTMHLFKYIDTSILEEKSKNYYLFLQSKGLRESYIFFHHLLRNMIITLVSYSKNIILFMISSLLIFEIILNMDGIMRFVKIYGIGDFRILIWVLIMIYVPSYFILKCSEWLIGKWLGYDITLQEKRDAYEFKIS